MRRWCTSTQLLLEPRLGIVKSIKYLQAALRQTYRGCVSSVRQPLTRVSMESETVSHSSTPRHCDVEAHWTHRVTATATRDLYTRPRGRDIAGRLDRHVVSTRPLKGATVLIGV